VLDDSGALVAVQAVGAQPHGDVYVLVRGASHQVQEPHGVVEASAHAAPQEVLDNNTVASQKGAAMRH
jgi:hypothetical protein